MRRGYLNNETHYFREKRFHCIYFMNGKKNGTWARYDKNDKLEYLETFKDDKLVKKKV